MRRLLEPTLPVVIVLFYRLSSAEYVHIGGPVYVEVLRKLPTTKIRSPEDVKPRRMAYCPSLSSCCGPSSRLFHPVVSPFTVLSGPHTRSTTGELLLED